MYEARKDLWDMTLLMTKFGRILRLMNRQRQKCSLFAG